jgi:hypothetical protein
VSYRFIDSPNELAMGLRPTHGNEKRAAEASLILNELRASFEGVNGYSPSNPSIAGTDGSQPRRETRETTCVLCNAQAACGFSCSASKRSSFFQSVKAIAAIFRANVRRAISGFIPLASKPR